MTAMRRHIECCKDCPKRHSGCHASCEDYLREKAELEELHAVMNTEKQAYALYANYHQDSKHKHRRHNSMRSRRDGKKL